MKDHGHTDQANKGQSGSPGSGGPGGAIALPTFVRWMIRRDMEEVCAIERHSFPDPWSLDQFLKVLRQRNAIGMVAEDHTDQITGFMIYELHNTRLHLLSFAVRPDARRRLVGTRMIEKLKGKLSYNRRTRLTLEIADYNLTGQIFFRSMGFRWEATVPGFFDGSRLQDGGDSESVDAYFMAYRIGSESEQWSKGIAAAATAAATATGSGAERAVTAKPADSLRQPGDPLPFRGHHRLLGKWEP
jgi:ribosomal-protein-alanine N-acetyltransferase